MSAPANVLVDPEDAHLLDEYRWTLDRGYVVCHIKGEKRTRKLYLHRVIAGEPEAFHVDHINGNKADCRKENLRWVTHSENQQNRERAARHSLTGVRGVHRRRESGVFLATVVLRGSHIHLGSFKTVEEASHAVIEGRRRLLTHSKEGAGVAVGAKEAETALADVLATFARWRKKK